ncbi:MAG: cardiolipin synthase [Synergistaceae bacterium]|jgi:cardiolipin synthase|nr:cardiolipin synthase [Synergistaceae bacterium]
MRYRYSLWKKLLLIGSCAFALGIMPYFWRVIFIEPHGMSAAQYLYGISSRALAVVSGYMPHIATAYVILIAALVFLEERNPDRTILWLMTLIFLPVVGVALYMFMGPDMKRAKMRRLFRPTGSYPPLERIEGERTSQSVRKTSTLAYRSSSSLLCEHNEVELLYDGVETFEAIKRELARAGRYINMEYYIFEDDDLGREIADILCRRASSGVVVRLTTDGVGSWKLGRGLIRHMQESGVIVRTFMPVSFPFFHSRLNFRNHRKIIVIDGEVAFTGGLNIGVGYMGKGPLGHWRDTHVMFRGEAVCALNEIFLSDWRISSGEELSPKDPSFSPCDIGSFGKLPHKPVQIVPSGGAAWRSIRQMYFMMIAEAQRRIWITTPYLIPGDAILEALKTAALAGVDVRLLIPGKSDHFLSHWASFSNIEDLLRSGARIWLYKKGFVHAKTLVSDDEIASVGTANLDNRSLDINFEVQAFIYDKGVCDELAGHFVVDMADSNECALSEWENRSMRYKVLESVGRLWSSQV